MRSAPDRTTTKSTRSRSGVSTTTLPDGSIASSSSQPDPRFGLLAGFSKAGSLERPGGQTAVTTGARTVVLSDPADPFSITTLNHTSTVEGRTATSSYDGATRRFTTTSPELRSRSLDIDNHGQLTAALP